MVASIVLLPTDRTADNAVTYQFSEDAANIGNNVAGMRVNAIYSG